MRRLAIGILVASCLLTVNPGYASAFAIKDTYHQMIKNYANEIRKKPENSGLSEEALWKKSEAYVVEVQRNRNALRYQVIKKPLRKTADIVGGDSYDSSESSAVKAGLQMAKQEVASLPPPARTVGTTVLGIASGALSVGDFLIKQEESSTESLVMDLATRYGISLSSDDKIKLDTRMRFLKQLSRSDIRLPVGITFDQYFHGTLTLRWPGGRVSYKTMDTWADDARAAIKRYDNGKRSREAISQSVQTKTQLTLDQAEALIALDEYVERQFANTAKLFSQQY